MPELPEVETIRRQLEVDLVGRSVSAIETRWPKSLTGRGLEPAALLGRPVTRIGRRGKVLRVDTEGGVSVLVHLRMTGQLLMGSAGPDAAVPEDTSATRVIFTLDDGSRCVFNDQRKFGRIVVLPTADVPDDPLLARMGPEPLEVAFTPEVLGAILGRRPGLRLKAALLDQGVVAGVGNIYADEVLWWAGLHPERRCGTVRRPGVEALHAGIVTVLSEGVDRGGSTLRNYVDTRGDSGGYLEVAAVYGRTGQACRRCGTSVVKITVVGRGTHLCPSCQTAPGRRRSGPA